MADMICEQSLFGDRLEQSALPLSACSGSYRSTGLVPYRLKVEHLLVIFVSKGCLGFQKGGLKDKTGWIRTPAGPLVQGCGNNQ